MTIPDRQRISTGTPWEEKVGYSRAVRVGNQVYVTGTIAADETGTIHHVGDPGGQTRYVLEKIRTALEACGATPAHVVRTTMYVTDITQIESIGAAHAEMFAEHRPCATMVEVSRLAAPDALVEIEVDAVM